jgi:hypothetical protein
MVQILQGKNLSKMLRWAIKKRLWLIIPSHLPVEMEIL